MALVDTRNLKKHLKACSKDELVELVLELSKIAPAADRLLAARFGLPHAPPDFGDHKAEVRAEFFPAKGFGNGNPAIAYRVLKRVEAEASEVSQILDFLYFCVETGVEFTDAYGDIDEEFYSAFEDLFEQAARMVSNHGLTEDYRRRARRIVSSTSEMGWGFHDELDRIFSKYFGS